MRRSGNSHMTAPTVTLRKHPVQERSAATFEALVEAAIQVLVRQGYRRFTTARVAEVAGVSVGSLYQYFPNKQALVRELIRRHVAALAERVCAAAPSSLAPADALRAVVAAFLAAKRENAAFSAALREPMRELDKRDLVQEAADRVAAHLLPFLARAHPDLPAPRLRLMAGLLVAAIEAPVMAAMEHQPDLLASPEFAEELTVLALGYLSRRG